MTAYLLDTHAYLWLLGDPTRVRAEVRDLLADPAHTLLVSRNVRAGGRDEGLARQDRRRPDLVVRGDARRDTQTGRGRPADTRVERQRTREAARSWRRSGPPAVMRYADTTSFASLPLGRSRSSKRDSPGNQRWPQRRVVRSSCVVSEGFGHGVEQVIHLQDGHRPRVDAMRQVRSEGALAARSDAVDRDQGTTLGRHSREQPRDDLLELAGGCGAPSARSGFIPCSITDARTDDPPGQSARSTSVQRSVQRKCTNTHHLLHSGCTERCTEPTRSPE
jgi:hypothetical protein